MDQASRRFDLFRAIYSMQRRNQPVFYFLPVSILLLLRGHLSSVRIFKDMLVSAMQYLQHQTLKWKDEKDSVTLLGELIQGRERHWQSYIGPCSREHWKSRQSRTDSSPTFPCASIGSRFLQSQSLRHHKNRHSPLEWSSCGQLVAFYPCYRKIVLTPIRRPQTRVNNGRG